MIGKLTIGDFREFYGYRKEFDVCLATPFFPRNRNASRYTFYNQLGEALEKLGKRVFIPYREIKAECPKNQTREIVSNIVVPSSELILADIKIPEYVHELIVSRAYELAILFISFYRNFSYEKVRKLLHMKKKYGLEKLQREWEAAKTLSGGVVELENDREGLETMVGLVKKFYGIHS